MPAMLAPVAVFHLLRPSLGAPAMLAPRGRATSALPFPGVPAMLAPEGAIQSAPMSLLDVLTATDEAVVTSQPDLKKNPMSTGAGVTATGRTGTAAAPVADSRTGSLACLRDQPPLSFSHAGLLRGLHP